MEKFPELIKYISEARTFGLNDSQIKEELLGIGWIESDIRFGMASSPKKESKRGLYSIIAILFFTVACLSGSLWFIWSNQMDLSEKNNDAVLQFYANLTNGNLGFTDAGDVIFPDQQKFLEVKQVFMEGDERFVEIDLDEMIVKVRKGEVVLKEYQVLSKGKEGSWWETPTGSYKVLNKEAAHFSSIGEVWMPWSMQFYGNFFIHGWPYYEGGTAVPKGYSGGCIRLSTEDAKDLYEIVGISTPILINEGATEVKLGGYYLNKDTIAPEVSANSYLVANLITGETLIKKKGEEISSLASMTKLMTAVVASELIYLERSILVRNDMVAAALAAFEPKEGDIYLAFDLLYPLLMQSSNESASILADYLGGEKFIFQMNAKSQSLGMKNTRFSDANGIQSNNLSSPDDMLKLLQYMYLKRKFLLEISKGKSFTTYSGNHSAELKNMNEFSADDRLIGMHGENKNTSQNMASVWEFKSENGIIPVAIVIFDSQDREKDAKEILSWIERSVEFN